MSTPRRPFARALLIAVQFTLPVALASGFTCRPAHSQPLPDIIAQAYTTSPKLEAERARLKASDEDIARALAGYRPVVRAVADWGYATDRYEPASRYSGGTRPRGVRLALSQTIFDGNKTTSSVNAAEARVLAARETLRATETQVLSDAVSAYTALVRDAQIVDLRSQHVRILERDTAAVRSQHRIGDKTLTDVAQAEARLAAARSAYDVAVVGLRASKATLRRIIGSDAVDPSEPGVPTADLPKTMEDAVTTGLTENPTLLAAIHRERAARFDIDIARSEFLPKFTFDAVTRSRKEENRLVDFHSETSVTGTIVVPLYSGGAESSGLRASKHLQAGRVQDIDQTRQDVEALVIQAWSRWVGAASRRKSDEAQISAALLALKGTREEEKSGLRSSLDVLNAQQDVITAQIALTTTRAEIVTASYALLAAMGRFNPERMAGMPSYDPSVNTAVIRELWFGEGPAIDAGREARRDARATPTGLRLSTASIDTASADAAPFDAEPTGGLLRWLGSALAGVQPRDGR